MSQRKLYKGKEFGSLVVLEDLPSEMSGGRLRAMALCECVCGVVKKIPTDNFVHGSTVSCGCYRLETKAYLPSNHRKYLVWTTMKSRCYNPNRKGYHLYGGRGIRIEEPWLSDASAFLRWYDENCGGNYNLVVDRIDNNGNYSPANCRLITTKENSRNTRQVRMITAFGETLPFSQMVEKYGKAPRSTIKNRIDAYGWDTEEAFTTPPDGKPYKPVSPHRKLKVCLNSIRSRCYNKDNPAYPNYGGRGIKVCDEWMEFKGKNSPGLDRFKEWAFGSGWEEGLSIDRIDVNGDYSPANCRWVTSAKNSLNRQNTQHYRYGDIEACAFDLVRDYGCPGLTQELFRKRVSQGWTVEEALESPLR